MLRRLGSFSVLALVLLGGCSSSPPDTAAGVHGVAESGPAEGGADRPASAETTATPKVANSADSEPPPVQRLEPLDPPSLADLDAKTTWVDRPVLSGMELRRRFEAESKPPLSVAEALKLRNTDVASNTQILSTLGRLPENAAQVDFNASVVRRVTMDVKSTNPILASTIVESDVLSLIGASFFNFDWKMQPYAMAETVQSWQASADGLLDKLVIRDDLTWSDGHPITAHDIVFSFQTIMDPEVPVPAQRSQTEDIRWVHAYDDQTVVYFHKKSLPTNVWSVNFQVIPRHVYAESLKADKTLVNSERHVLLENEPVCGGPYILKSRTRGAEMVFARRDSYFFHQGKQVRDLEHFQEVRLKVIEDSNTALLALRKGDTHDLELSAEQWVAEPTNNDEYYAKNTKVTGPEWTYFHIVWNVGRPYFADRRVRHAMSYAYDYDQLLQKFFHGLYQPGTGLFHPDSWMAPKTPIQPFKFDLDQAEKLLDEAGWIDDDGDGVREKVIDGKKVPFEFSLNCSNDPVRVRICSLLKENLDRIGVKCNVRPLEPTVLFQNGMEHNFDAMFAGLGTGADPDTSDNLYGTRKERNYGQYSNPEVDALFVQGRGEFDREKRAAIYGRIAELIYADQPCTWLYYRNAFYGFNKKLRGYQFSPRGPYHFGPGFSAIWQPLVP